MNLGSPKKPEVPGVIKHVIEEYRHRTQTITCVCGWTGSSATGPAQPSPWSLHVAEMRPKR